MSDQTNDTPPVTDAGRTEAAGAGMSDQEMAAAVAGQTSPDLAVEDVFEREADGADSDGPVADATADDLA